MGQERTCTPALAIVALLGLDFPRTRCPLHDDRNPSGAFFEGERGEWVFHCHAGCGTYSLAGLWLHAKYGVHPGWISKTEFAVWCRRLGIELREVATADTLPPAPGARFGRASDVLERLPAARRLRADGGLRRVAAVHALFRGSLVRTASLDGEGRTQGADEGGLARDDGDVVTVGFKEAHRWRPGPRAIGRAAHEEIAA